MEMLQIMYRKNHGHPWKMLGLYPIQNEPGHQIFKTGRIIITITTEPEPEEKP